MNIDSLMDNLLVNKSDNNRLVLSPALSDFHDILSNSSTALPKTNKLNSSNDCTIQINPISMLTTPSTDEAIEVESLESPKTLNENKASLDKTEDSQIELVDPSSTLFYLTGLIPELPLIKPIDAEFNPAPLQTRLLSENKDSPSTIPQKLDYSTPLNKVFTNQNNEDNYDTSGITPVSSNKKLPANKPQDIGNGGVAFDSDTIKNIINQENHKTFIPNRLNSSVIDSEYTITQTNNNQSNSISLNTAPLATKLDINETTTNDHFALTSIIDASKKMITPPSSYKILTEITQKNKSLETTHIEPSNIINPSNEPHQLIFENLTQVINNNLNTLDFSKVDNKPFDSIPTPLPSQALPSELQEAKATLLDIQRNISENNSHYSMEGASAKIKIHPIELGEINAEIIINKGQAELTLTIESSPVKHLIEMHLQELRHSFNDLPINLTQVTVQTNNEQTNRSFNEEFNRRQTQSDSNQTKNTSLASKLTNESKKSDNSLIDAYA